MYGIAQAEISAVNGLGANGEWWNANGANLVTTLVNAGTSIANTAINAKNNQNPNQNTQTTTNNGTSTNQQPVYVYTGGDNTAKQTQEKSITDYLPWIIGGVVVLIGGAYVLMNNNGRRR